MTLILRRDRPPGPQNGLTNNEIDTNFEYLNDTKASLNDFWFSTSFYVPEKVEDGEDLVVISSPRDFTIPENFSDSVFLCLGPPVDGDATINVLLNGILVGSVVFEQNTGTVLSSSIPETDVERGDVLRFVQNYDGEGFSQIAITINGDISE